MKEVGGWIIFIIMRIHKYIYPASFPVGAKLFGSSLLIISEKLQELGLSSSDRDTAIRWCGRSPDLLRDYRRRHGGFARVAPSTVAYLRHRLAAAARIVSKDLAIRLRALDAEVVRNVEVYELLGRRHGR